MPCQQLLQRRYDILQTRPSASRTQPGGPAAQSTGPHLCRREKMVQVRAVLTCPPPGDGGQVRKMVQVKILTCPPPRSSPLGPCHMSLPSACTQSNLPVHTIEYYTIASKTVLMMVRLNCLALTKYNKFSTLCLNLPVAWGLFQPSPQKFQGECPL